MIFGKKRNLDKQIMNEILGKIGIKSLNPMQVAVGKEISSSQKDVVILSPTGTGKTLAYMLPLQEQLDRDDINVQMLVIVPGRELACSRMRFCKA